MLATLRQQAHLNAHLQHQLEQILRRLYGRKSEKLDPGQLWLFAQEIAEAGGPEITPRPAPADEPPAKPKLLLGAFSYRTLKRGSWRSRAEFIDFMGRAWPEYNRLYAHPFEWTWSSQKMRKWVEKHGL